MSIAYDILFTLTSRYVILGLQLLASIIVVRAYNIDALGYYALLRMTPIVMNMFCGLGLTSAIPYCMGQRAKATYNVINNLFTIGILLAAIMTALWIAMVPLLESRMFQGLDHRTLMLSACLPAFVYYNNLLNASLQGLEMIRSANLCRVTKEVVSVVALCAAIFYPLHIIWLVFAIISSHVTSLFAAFFMLKRQGEWHLRLTLNGNIIRRALSYGVRAQLGNIANLLNVRLDVLILSVLSSPGIVGLYVIASKMAEILRSISSSIFFVLYPKTAHCGIIEATKRVIVIYLPLMSINLIIAALCYLCLPRFMIVIYGREAATAIYAFYILLVGTTVLSVNGIISSFNAGVGKPEYNTYAVVIGMLVMTSCSVILIPIYGLIGAAISSTIGYILNWVITLYFFSSQTGIGLPTLLFRRVDVIGQTFIEGK